MGADWWTNMFWLVLIDEEWVLIGVHWCWWVLLGWCWLLNTLRTNVLINWVRKSGPVPHCMASLIGKTMKLWFGYGIGWQFLRRTHLLSNPPGNPAICQFKLAGDTGDLWKFLSTQELASKYWCLTFVFCLLSSMFIHCCYYSCFFPIWQDTICSVSYIRFSSYHLKKAHTHTWYPKLAPVSNHILCVLYHTIMIHSIYIYIYIRIYLHYIHKSIHLHYIIYIP